jgi:hypothetical protein
MQYTFRQLTSRPDSKGRCRVLLDVTWGNQREKLVTGVSCQPANFAPEAKLGRTIAKAEPGSPDMNTKLAGLVADIADLFNKALSHRQTVTRDQVLAFVRKPSKVIEPVTPAALDPLDTNFLNYIRPVAVGAPRLYPRRAATLSTSYQPSGEVPAWFNAAAV